MQFDAPFGHALIAKYAMAARRHMHEFGTTIEQLAEIAVSTRYNASLNPEAYYREPITIDDVQTSRMIADPLTKLHCCIRSDGGGAVVLTSEERAKDLPKKPVWVLGTGEATSHTTMSEWEDFTESPAAQRTARVRAGRRDARRDRHLPDLRRVHVDGAADVRGPRVLQEGRRRARSSPTAACASTARCRPTPTAAASRTATRACAACSCSWRRPVSCGARPTAARSRTPSCAA